MSCRFDYECKERSVSEVGEKDVEVNSKELNRH